jgi:C1A family cysteine protease
MAQTTYGLGWIPDLPDHRDVYYSALPTVLSVLPTQLDLRAQCPPVYDQGQVGSCTANAIAGAIQFDRLGHNQAPDFVPARLFIYYNERVIEHSVNSDAGAMIRDGVKSTHRLGVCPEALWPYDGGATPDNGGTNEKVFQKPPQNCYTEAAKHQVQSYMRVMQNLNQMRSCLSEGYPFVFGFVVYESFMSDEVKNTGKVPMPGSSERQLGGHAVLAVGYDDEQQMFIVRNSWGTSWGLEGYFLMPYAYLIDTSLASDFWTIRTVES